MPEEKGKVFDTTNFEKRWRAATKAAGLIDFRFHDLRHTFASWARQSGADIADVKDALGHSDISMTMRYAHIRPDAENTAFDKVSAALAAHSAPHILAKTAEMSHSTRAPKADALPGCATPRRRFP
jgi:integrase